MKIVMLTRERTHVEYVFDSLQIQAVKDNEIYCAQGTLTIERYIIVEDEVEVSVDDEITPELLALDKTANYISTELSLDETIKKLEEDNKKIQEEKIALENRTNSMENSMLMMMDMFEQVMGKGIDLPF